MQRGNIAASTPSSALARLDGIAQARSVLLHGGVPDHPGLVEPWIARSWKRCLSMGRRPHEAVAFDALTPGAVRRTRDANLALTQASHGVLLELGRALADTRYFAILTNADGIVINASGPIDHSDRRADLITRIGVDLSERSVGTTAIGAALTELQPVWLHRGEHFFDDTAVYSCAGAPLFGPAGQCVGMLDLTGVDVPERPELIHLVMQSARSIENAMALQRPHTILLRVNWPGTILGADSDGLIGMDDNGRIVTCNRAARDLLPHLNRRSESATDWPHADELFALPFSMLFDAARNGAGASELPLWSGLRLQVLASPAGRSAPPRRSQTQTASTRATSPPDQRRLRDIETALIREAVDHARGNVAQAAAQLGVSRATVYRKLRMRTS